MKAQSITIQKHPQLSDSSNYEWLRKKGLEYIEQLGSDIWTDYNIHDPGITFLEMLCYAITDLGYKTSFDIQDLLAEPLTGSTVPDYNRQGFFTAANILTVNPLTTADFRKLLIDINGIKNGWLKCKQCACDNLLLYANCATSKLQYNQEANTLPVIIKGFYDVLIEFENTAGDGDLNSGKVKYNFSFPVDGAISTAMIEIRMPSWQIIHSNQLAEKYFLGDKTKVEQFMRFIQQGTTVKKVETKFISGNKNDNADIPASQVVRILRRPVFATIEVTFNTNEGNLDEVIILSDIPLTIWFRGDADRRAILLEHIKTALSDISASGIFAAYLSLIQQAETVIKITKERLHGHRNLCEDFCSISGIAVQDVGVCADMELDPSAEIEAVLAEAYYRIDQYFSPDIKFYSLKELMEKGIPVDEIFEGQQLSNGFINNDELDNTNLKQFIYTSDIINLLMDIPGVQTVKNLVLTQFDEDGNLVNNEEWVLEVPPNHQPRLYIEASKILVFKNGLPFLPDRLELKDTLQVIKGQHAQPNYSLEENDLPVPQGTFYQMDDYYPVQYSLPQTYGISPEGLPSTASIQRRAQAKQLRAYLMFFEQMLLNYLKQLTNVKELFAIDASVSTSYFTKLINNNLLQGVDELYQGLDENALQSLIENEEEFFDRRNRFLDHLLARFAENFNEYALMLYSYSTSKAFADTKLIKDKVNFLHDLPFLTRNRAKAFNYKNPALVCNAGNVSGLQLRIQRLLGMDSAAGKLEMYEETDTDGVAYERRWRLRDEGGKIQLSSSTRYVHEDLAESEGKALDEFQVVKRFITDAGRYEVKKEKVWVVNLTDTTGEVIATRKQPFKTKALAEAARDGIIAFGKKLVAADKVFLVEHLLLRPRNIPSLLLPLGDPLLSVCLPDDCEFCGDQDPYSFRLTVVLSGESGIANSGIEFRNFAEKTIRSEVPAHLGVKICWVSDIQLIEFEEVHCDWLAELAKETPNAVQLNDKLQKLLIVFENLKSVYPDARLHDCKDGDDSNRVFLNNTII